MGIPSYFSYIIKNYTGIIRKLNQCPKFQHLFMDCNSIIYSAYANISSESKSSVGTQTTPTTANIEQKIIQDVVFQIKNYIKLISPTKSVFIAFDGVAPFAKMNQQRVRRYKTDFMNRHPVLSDHGKPAVWDTTAITPGTVFMDKLNRSIQSEFYNKSAQYGVEKIWVSGSNETGEGEHKLFAKIRTKSAFFKNDQIAIYGLDSDLIMLSVFHLKYCEGIQVFRETPEFKTVIRRDFSSKSKEQLFMNIGELSAAISAEMHVTAKQQMSTVYDYIFMCFFLGNDFMPHFPAFNIRTHGVQILTETYRNVIGSHPNKSFVDGKTGKIHWKWVNEFVASLAKQEYGHFTTEMATRDRSGLRNWTSNTPEEKEQIVQNIPMIHRADEKYICISESGWEKRYYKMLFHRDPTEENIRDICVNYIEGLEWVTQYYTNKCVDWRWKYKYHYPPLMKDLAKYVQTAGPNIKWTESAAVSPRTQLAYVLPLAKLDLCSNKKVLLDYFPNFYPPMYEFQWAFCRFFWEAHPLLPDISIDELESVCDNIIMNCATSS